MSSNGPFANDSQYPTAAESGHEATDEADNGPRSSPDEDERTDDVVAGSETVGDEGVVDEASVESTDDSPGPAGIGPSGEREAAPSDTRGTPLAPGEQTLEPDTPVTWGDQQGSPAPQWLPNRGSASLPEDPEVPAPPGLPDRGGSSLLGRDPEVPAPLSQLAGGQSLAEPDSAATTEEQPSLPAPQPLPDPVTSVETGPITVPAQRATTPPLSSPHRSPRHRAKRPLGDGRVVNERIRHIAPKSVLKISAIFYSCVALVFLVSSVLLWSFARGTGTVEDIESFVTQLFTYGDCVAEDELELGQDFRESDQCPTGRVMVGSFEINDGALFRSIVLGGILFVVVATVGTVFMVLLFNLLSDVTGGVRYSIVREPLGTPKSSTSSGSRR